MTTMHIFIGTAGWSVGSRYAEQFPKSGTQLQRYAALLNAVEINSSFYRSHRRATYERWATSVPDGFRFAVKMPKAITHERKLVDSDAALDRFLDETSGLGQKLGVLLMQLPPSLNFEPTAVSLYLAGLRARTKAAVVCEPRHASWFSEPAETLLRAHHVTRAAVDPAPVNGAASSGGWEGLTYMRLHGSPKIYYSNYDGAALQRIGRRLKDLGSRGSSVWCIFDNTAASHALGNALALPERLAETGADAIQQDQA